MRLTHRHLHTATQLTKFGAARKAQLEDGFKEGGQRNATQACLFDLTLTQLTLRSFASSALHVLVPRLACLP